MTSSSTSAFAPGRPASVGLAVKQELQISEFRLFALSSSSGTGSSDSTDASGMPSENYGTSVRIQVFSGQCISSIAVVIKW